MTAAEFAARYPVLYHTADGRNWPGIRRHGLLSTAALLDLYQVAGPARDAVEAAHRPAIVPISHPAHGQAYIRDQKPMPPAALARCLDGIAPEDWRRLLNGRVYFWPTADRLERMLNVYLGDEQAVFEVDAGRLLARYAGRAEVSRINSGSAIRRAARRGRGTFVPLADFTHSARNTIAELTVPYAVPDIFDFTVRVTARRRGRAARVLWPG